MGMTWCSCRERWKSRYRHRAGDNRQDLRGHRNVGVPPAGRGRRPAAGGGGWQGPPHSWARCRSEHEARGIAATPKCGLGSPCRALRNLSARRSGRAPSVQIRVIRQRVLERLDADRTLYRECLCDRSSRLTALSDPWRDPASVRRPAREPRMQPSEFAYPACGAASKSSIGLTSKTLRASMLSSTRSALPHYIRTLKPEPSIPLGRPSFFGWK